MTMNSGAARRAAVFTSERWESAVTQLRMRSPLRAAGIEVVRGFIEGSAAPDVACIQDSDLVLIQRDFPRFAQAYRAVVDAARAHGKPIVYEIDDLMWDMPPDHPVYARYRDSRDGIVQAICAADWVTTTTATLADRLRMLNPNTAVLPNCIDLEVWPMRRDIPPTTKGEPETGGDLVIGYMGSGTHGPDLQMIEPALLQVLQTFRDRVTLELFNEMPTSALMALPNVRRLDGTPNYADYVHRLAGRQWHIGIAPLRDTPFNRCKSALKYLEFGAIGVACVFSNIAPFREVVNHGETGLLASSTEDWVQHLSRLIDDASLRTQIASNAERDVHERWLIGQHADEWRRVCEEIQTLRVSSLPTVSVIVLTHNGKRHLNECFDSLHRQDYPADKLRLVLADNASSDDSIEHMRAHYPRVEIFEVGSNAGFCVAYNRAITASQTDYVALLNDDMRVEPDWLIQMVRAAQSEPDVMCVGAKILTWDGAAVDFAGHEYSPLGYASGTGYGDKDLTTHDEQRYLFAASGGSMLIQRAAFLEAGGFDESFFAYYEDLDLGWRLWALGYKTVYAPKSIAYHKHFSTWSRSPGPRVAHLYERNTLFALIKNADQPFFERAVLPAILMRIRLAYLNGMNAGLRLDQIQVKPGQAQPNATADATAFDAKHYTQQALHALRNDGPLGLARKVVDEFDRRRGKRPPQTLKQTPLLDERLADADINELLGQDAFWHEQAIIAAINDVIERYDVLMAERAKLQARRKLSDADIFAMTKAITLRPWFDDPAYQRSHRMLLSAFGLDTLDFLQSGGLHRSQEERDN